MTPETITLSIPTIIAAFKLKTKTATPATVPIKSSFYLPSITTTVTNISALKVETITTSTTLMGKTAKSKMYTSIPTAGMIMMATNKIRMSVKTTGTRTDTAATNKAKRRVNECNWGDYMHANILTAISNDDTTTTKHHFPTEARKRRTKSQVYCMSSKMTH